MMPTIDDALDYMGIDYADEKIKKNVQRKLNAAVKIVQGSVGEDVDTYLPGDERVAELILAHTDILYHGGGGAKVDAAVQHLIDTTESQLRLELRRAKEAKEEAGAV